MATRTVAERAERRAICSIAGLTAHIVNDSDAIAARARRGLEAKFLAEAGGDPRKAKLIKRLHYQRMALARAQTAKAKERGRNEATTAEEVADRTAVTS